MAVCLIIVIGVTILLVLIKLYTKLSAGKDNSYTCLVGKTVLITGANTGVGFITALEMAKRGGRVIIACRDKEKAENAKQQIVRETDNENIVVEIVDLSSLASVRDFAKRINESEKRLDILVNNAGAAGSHSTTKDNLELTMQVNYFGHFLLTFLLIDLLKKSSPSRIVNVSSVMGKFAQLDPEDINKFIGLPGMYNNSKLCNILFTKELHRKLAGKGVTTYSLHPGAVVTEIFRAMAPYQKKILKFVQWICFKTAEEGAQTQIYVSLAKGIEKFSGEHFSDCNRVNMYKTAAVPGLQKRVWENTEVLVKLTEEEKKLI